MDITSNNYATPRGPYPAPCNIITKSFLLLYDCFKLPLVIVTIVQAVHFIVT
jgi:hypothetical protein